MDAPSAIQPDILAGIIDQLEGDLPTLRSCSLVCQAWLPPAHSHLFRRISLEPPKVPQRRLLLFNRSRATPCQRLLQVLTGDSISTPGFQSTHGRSYSIASYIRELRLCEGMTHPQWLTSELALPHLLNLLDNLTSFELSRSASMRIIWRELPKELRTAIGDHIFTLPSLNTLKLHGLVLSDVREFVTMVGKCSTLRTLALEQISFEDEATDVGQQSATVAKNAERRTPVDTLTIGPRVSLNILSCLAQTDSPIDISTVRTMHLSISGNFQHFARLLQKVISLESLEINLMNDIDLQAYWALKPDDRLSLSSLAYLRTLKIHIDTIQKQDDPLPWISNLLQTAGRNQITNIGILYSLYLPAPYMDRSVNTTIFGAWKDIDAVLSGHRDPDHGNGEEHRRYRDLERVQLDFMLENPIGFGIAPRFLKEVVLESPGLEERGILHIDAFDTSH